MDLKYKLKIIAVVVTAIGLVITLILDLITRREEIKARHEEVKAKKISDERFEATVKEFKGIVEVLKKHSEETNMQFDTSVAKLQSIASDLGQTAKHVSRIDIPLDLVTVRWSVAIKFERPLDEIPQFKQLIVADRVVKTRSGQKGIGVLDGSETPGRAMGAKEFEEHCPSLTAEVPFLNTELKFYTDKKRVIHYSGSSTKDEPPRLSFVAVSEESRVIEFNIDFPDCMGRNQDDDLTEINILSLAGTSMYAKLFHSSSIGGNLQAWFRDLKGEVAGVRLYIVSEDGRKAIELDGSLFPIKNFSSGIYIGTAAPIASYKPFVQPNFYVREFMAGGRLLPRKP